MSPLPGRIRVLRRLRLKGYQGSEFGSAGVWNGMGAPSV